jgi:hypothetical protein
MGRPLARIAAALTAVLLCGLATAGTPVAAVPAPLDRIDANTTNLVNVVTGTTFTPRGANYVRLAKSSHDVVFHSNFEPGLYSTTDVQAVLDGLKDASGYNTVRVFVDPGDGHLDHGLAANPGANGLNAQYMANFADFVLRAAAKGIYVLPTLSAFPFNQHYLDIVYTTNGGGLNPAVSGVNRFYMDRGFIAAKEAYLRNFVADLESRLGDQRSAVLAYQIENEAFWEGSEKPLNTRSGMFVGPDGLSYDMANAGRRQQAADASMVVLTNKAVTAVRTASPDAMVTIGFFTNQAVGKPGYTGFPVHCTTSCNPTVDYRYPGRPASISAWSTVDFIDLHAYPQGGGYTLTGDLASSEVGLVGKPYIIGEFGAMKSVYQNNIVTAAYAMRDTQVASCTIGHGAKGWLFWTYDTDLVNPDLASQGLFYSLADSRGAINGVLASVVRPNPCSP